MTARELDLQAGELAEYDDREALRRAASAMGKKGGLSRSQRKIEASRQNVKAAQAARRKV